MQQNFGGVRNQRSIRTDGASQGVQKEWIGPEAK